MSNENEVEKEIQEKGLTAPRITPEHIDAQIVGSDYHVFRETCLTVCCLTLKNGFSVTGESACASPENFDAELGKKIAFENARNKIWALEGYLLKTALTSQSIELVAKAAHEINKAYCEALGDMSQPEWEDAPEWQRQSAIAGVEHHISNPNCTPEGSHESWLAQKEADGWVYGEVKDPEKKEHPCMVPYEQLPVEQKAKDYLFRQVVHSMFFYR